MPCKTCRFFKTSNLPARGNCRFDPPVVQFVPAEMLAQSSAAPGIALPSKASRMGATGTAPVQGFAPLSALPLVLESDFCHNFTEEIGTRQ